MNWCESICEIPEGAPVQELETEVVVLGLGYSGTAALRAAAESGARCIGIDSQREGKYHSYGRDFGHINSKFLKSRGVPETDPIELFNEWMRRAGNRANPRLVMKYCRESGAAFDWFTDMYSLEELSDLHIAFWPKGGKKLKEAKGEDAAINGYHFWYGTAEFPEPMGWPGKPTITDAVLANLEKAEQSGAQILWGTEALRLTKENGRVTGAIVKRADGTFCRLCASKSVILALGDFSRNEEMVMELCCDHADIYPPEAKKPPRLGRNGAGIRMGVQAGGRLESRPLPTMGGNLIALNAPYSYGSIWLAPDGKRFCNELFGGTELVGFAGNQMGADPIYCVFDEHIVENELQWAFPGHCAFDENNPLQTAFMEELFEKKNEPSVEIKLPPPVPFPATIYTGKTPEELVKNAGIGGELAEEIIASIRHYNELCEKGRDEDFGRDRKLLDPLTDTLFLQIAHPSSILLVTVGGLVTDENQQVLDENYQRIPGLYATGNCCGRRFGSQYATPISGVSIGIAFTLGRDCGIQAAK